MSDRPRKPDLRAARAAKAAQVAKAAEAARAAAASAKDATEAARARTEASRARLERRQERVVARQETKTRAVEVRKVQLTEQLKRRRAKRERRWGRVVVPALLAIILLLLLRDCQEEPEPEPVVAEVVGGPRVAVRAPAVPEPPPKPAPAPPKVPRRDRPEMIPPPARVPPWLVAFRMQVSARSPRLARCFEGSDQPGRIKWTASVEPSSGQVGDHVIEPQLLTGELSQREKRCLEEALSTPDYRIPPTDETGPRRVSVVLEF